VASPDLRRLADAALEATVVGSFTNLGIRARRRLGPWEDLDAIPLAGRVVVITGATSGLGLASAHRLAGMGASVRVVGRNPEKAAAACRAIIERSGNTDVRAYVADLGRLDDVARLADEIAAGDDRLDVLVHNAGALSSERTESAEGHELTYAVMVLAPTLLTERLLPRLERSAPSRVVFVSSGGMYTRRLDVDDIESRSDYRGAVAYAKAKRAQVVLAEVWGERWQERGIVVHAMHPGWADTPGIHESLPTFERVMRPLLRTADEGADTIVWLAASDEPMRSTGRFWLDRRVRSPYRVPGTRESAGDRDRLGAIVAADLTAWR